MEREDFELADELNGKIEAAEVELAKAKQKQSEVEAECEEAARG